jgi:hypothetical protein
MPDTAMVNTPSVPPNDTPEMVLFANMPLVMLPEVPVVITVPDVGIVMFVVPDVVMVTA